MSATGATPEGTSHYVRRFPGCAPDFFKLQQGLAVSGIGIGTYLGPADDATQHRYVEAVAAAIRGGCNVVDTAINYRYMRSERAVGEAIRQMRDDGIGREEIILATKGGAIPWDGGPPTDSRSYIKTRYIDTGICQPHDIVAGTHCFAPGFLREQLTMSLANLAVDAIDLYLLHNPETQLTEMPYSQFLVRMAHAFEYLEEEARSGRIQHYGIATWGGLRLPAGDRRHVAILDLLDTAASVAGKSHHFRVLQLPFNMAMPEALLVRNQRIAKAEPHVSALECCRAHGMLVMTSASIGQGRLSGMPADLLAQLFPEAGGAAQALLQFARSAAGVTTALVGSANKLHVAENLRLMNVLCAREISKSIGAVPP